MPTEHGQPSAYLIDVDDIAEYIALHNIKAAKALVQKVFNKVERLIKKKTQKMNTYLVLIESLIM